MADTFPGLQSDANTLIRQANELILLARQLRAHASRGDAAAVQETCREIGRCGPPIESVCDAFASTARDFIVYTTTAEEG